MVLLWLFVGALVGFLMCKYALQSVCAIGVCLVYVLHVVVERFPFGLSMYIDYVVPDSCTRAVWIF